MVIIGSTALKYHFPEDYPREPKDLDIVVEHPERFGKIKGVEFLANPILLDYMYLERHVISPNMLLTLKISHIFWDNDFEKHMYDIQFLLDKGCKYYENVVLELMSYWEEVLPKVRRSKLDQSKEEFFTNAVNEDVGQHDYLHTLINPVPMYTRILKDGCEVELDEFKWNKLSHEDKLEVVREETYVMSFERYKDLHYVPAYMKQLKANIQKHFPIYIALFAIENYKELLEPKINYKQILENDSNRNT